MTTSCAKRAEPFRISSFGFPSAFVIRISSFDLAFHISNRRESRNWLANSREFGRGDYFINILVGGPGFLGEPGP